MKNQLLKAVLLASIALAMPLAANAASTPDTSAPVRLNSVEMSPMVGGFGDLESGLVDVSFTNLAPQAANDVLFYARDNAGRVIGSYDDRGTFSQGVTIHHAFSVANAYNAPKLDVEKVTFADGSEWVSGQANPLSRRQAAETDAASVMLTAMLGESAN